MPITRVARHTGTRLQRLRDEGDTPLQRSLCLRATKKGTDQTNTNGWRPITLASTLGKVIESTMATRLGRTGAARKWLGLGQADGIPHIGTLDLIQATVHTLRRNRAIKKTTAMLLLDIKGAFSAVKTLPMTESMR